MPESGLYTRHLQQYIRTHGDDGYSVSESMRNASTSIQSYAPDAIHSNEWNVNGCNMVKSNFRILFMNSETSIPPLSHSTITIVHEIMSYFMRLLNLDDMTVMGLPLPAKKKTPRRKLIWSNAIPRIVTNKEIVVPALPKECF